MACSICEGAEMTEDIMKCENCGKDCEELVTREGFCMTHFVDFVCEECFKDLEGKQFADYNIEDYYGAQ